MKKSQNKILSTLLVTMLIIVAIAGFIYAAIESQDKQNHIHPTGSIGKSLTGMRNEAKALETSRGNKHKITQWTVKNLRRPQRTKSSH